MLTLTCASPDTPLRQSGSSSPCRKLGRRAHCGVVIPPWSHRLVTFVTGADTGHESSLEPDSSSLALYRGAYALSSFPVCGAASRSYRNLPVLRCCPRFSLYLHSRITRTREVPKQEGLIRIGGDACMHRGVYTDTGREGEEASEHFC